MTAYDLESPGVKNDGVRKRPAQDLIKECSFDEAVELTGHGAYNYFQLTTCTMIVLAATLDMFGHSVTVAAAACDLQLTVAETGLLASAPFVGVISAFPWGFYADTHGRRKALMVSTTVGFTFSAMSSLAPSWQVMFGLKLIGCLFSTAAFTIAMTYLGECTITKHRSQYLFIVNTADLAADAIYFGIALYLLPATFSYPIPWLGITFRPWRLFSLLMAMPLLLGTLMMLPLKESPKFLANNGQAEEALEVMRVMYERNVGKDAEFPVKSLAKVKKDCEEKVSFWRSLIEQTVPLFKPPLLWTTLKLFYLIAACCSLNNVFLMWYPTMVNQFFNSMTEVRRDYIDDRSFCYRVVSNITVGEFNTENPCSDVMSVNTLYAGIILGVLFATVNLLAGFVARYKREVLLVTFLVPAVCLVLINQVTEPIVNLIAFTMVQSTGIGFSSLASYYVDLYPTAYRGMAWSLGMMVGRLASMGGVNLMAAVIVNYCSATFYSWTAYACSALMLAMMLPSGKKDAK